MSWAKIAEQTTLQIAKCLAWHDLSSPSPWSVGRLHLIQTWDITSGHLLREAGARRRWDRQPRPFKPKSPKSICTRPLCHRNPSRTTDAPRRSCAGCLVLERASRALFLALFAALIINFSSLGSRDLSFLCATSSLLVSVFPWCLCYKSTTVYYPPVFHLTFATATDKAFVSLPLN